jgi:hypothetical protein
MADQRDDKTYVIPSQESEIPDTPADAGAQREADTAGDPAGTAGTGGENKVQDAQFER